MEDNIHAQRKNEHYFIAEKLYQADAHNGLDQVQLHPDNLPELALADVDLRTTLVGQPVNVPFFINAITGGSQQTTKINQQLATVAAQTGIPMAVGSESIALKLGTTAGFEVIRQANPDGFVLGNLGAGHNLHNARKAVRLINADALEIHLNVAQELTMPEGDRSFKWSANLREIITHLEQPVLVKEVGTGMSTTTLEKLRRLGVKYVDLSGAGGTNFVAIENERRHHQDFGFLHEISLSTAQSLLLAQDFSHDFEFTASGGIRSALDIAKCLVLGAHNVGISGQFLHILIKHGPDALVTYIETLKDELRNIMVLLGCQRVSDLHQVAYTLSPELWSFKRQHQNNN